MPTHGDVTQLLERWEDGDASAADRLMPLVYEKLRTVAANRLRGERPGHTLQATALVNEAYLRMVGSDMNVKGRAHFFGLAAQIMRRILVDHARARDAVKRGGGGDRLSLTEVQLIAPEDSGAGADVLVVHEALEALESHDARKAKVVEMLVFGGLTYPEVAAALDISPATVDRDFRFARAWLASRLAD